MMATIESDVRVAGFGNGKIHLAPGKPVEVPDGDVESLLDFGKGFGRRLLAAGKIRIRMGKPQKMEPTESQIVRAVAADEAVTPVQKPKKAKKK